jgi:hypothetical protein
MNKKQIKRYKFSFIFLVFIAADSFFLTACWTPDWMYLEVKRMGITIIENCLYLSAEIGGNKVDNSTLMGGTFSVFKYPLVAQTGMAKQTGSDGLKDVEDFKEALVFSIILEDMRWYDWIKKSDDYYIRGEPSAAAYLRTKTNLFFSDAFKYKDRYFTLVKIEFERSDNMYYIRKIGDYQYDDDSALREGLIRGTSCFEEGAEYLIVFYPPFYNHFRSPAIPPVRFAIINGIPIIRLVD